MATEPISLTIVPGGVGPAIAVSHLSAKKTVSAKGFTNAPVIEASADGGVTFCPVANFGNLNLSNPKDDKITILFAATHMRVDATNSPTLTSVSVQAERGLIRSGVIPSPPGGGAGASLDVKNFGCESAIYLTGYTGSGGIQLEISADEIDWSPILQKLNGDGCVRGDFSTVFIRAVSTGTATGDLTIASEEPAISGLTNPQTVIVWAPEDPAGDRGNIYTGTSVAAFKAVVDACRATLSNGIGRAVLMFESQFSSVNDGEGGAACEIPDSSGQPGGEWDFSDDIWWTTSTEFGARVIFADGAKINVGRTLTLEGYILLISHDGTAHSPFDDFFQQLIFINGGRTELFTRNAAALPLIKARLGTGGSSFFNLVSTGIHSFGGLGRGNNPSPAPIVDLNGSGVNVAWGEGFLQDNIFTDSDQTTGFSRVRFVKNGPMSYGRGGRADHTFPALGANGAVGSSTPIQDFVFVALNQMHIGGRSNFIPPFALTTADGFQFHYNEHQFFDTTAGDVKTFLPFASPATGQPITVSNVVGTNNLLLEVKGGTGSGNVRNTGGVDDVIDFATVPPGMTATYYCDGGNGAGQGVGHWNRTAYASAASAAYTPTNVTPDRAFDADTVAVAELADVVGSMITDLQSAGILG